MEQQRHRCTFPTALRDSHGGAVTSHGSGRGPASHLPQPASRMELQSAATFVAQQQQPPPMSSASAWISRRHRLPSSEWRLPFPCFSAVRADGGQAAAIGFQQQSSNSGNASPAFLLLRDDRRSMEQQRHRCTFPTALRDSHGGAVTSHGSGRGPASHLPQPASRMELQSAATFVAQQQQPPPMSSASAWISRRHRLPSSEWRLPFPCFSAVRESPTWFGGSGLLSGLLVASCICSAVLGNMPLLMAKPG
nr:hypothetical protein Itr_chr13CG16790 [Ipomoea trifida]